MPMPATPGLSQRSRGVVASAMAAVLPSEATSRQLVRASGWPSARIAAARWVAWRAGCPPSGGLGALVGVDLLDLLGLLPQVQDLAAVVEVAGMVAVVVHGGVHRCD